MKNAVTKTKLFVTAIFYYIIIYYFMFATAFVSNKYAEEISFDVADGFPRTVPAFISAAVLRFLQFFCYQYKNS